MELRLPGTALGRGAASPAAGGPPGRCGITAASYLRPRASCTQARTEGDTLLCPPRASTHKAMVHPEERHLTGLIQEVRKGDEGVGSVQVQAQHCSYEGHALHLQEGTGQLTTA